jgi:prephenate dehydrogenase
MLFDQLTIVGVGLLGGSVGLAAKKRGVARQVGGVDPGPQVISKALAVGAIDSGTSDLHEGVRSADLIVVCTSVDGIAAVIRDAATACPPGAIFTDVGSTKASVIADVKGLLPAGIEYVPAHPVAGSEKSGVENALADLFVNRATVVTPLSSNTPEKVERVVRFWSALGSTVSIMSAEEHDRTLAVTSHLPHAVATALAGMTPLDFLKLTAGGYRDVTRIAAGNPRMWASIFLENREPLGQALNLFADRLNELRRLLEAGDSAGLVKWLTEAKQVRDALGC